MQFSLNKLRTSLVGRVTVLASLGIFISVLTVMSIALVRDLNRSVEAERDLLLAYSGVFAAAVSPAMAEGDRSAAEVALTGMSRLPRVTYARLETSDGQQWIQMGTDYILEGKTMDLTDAASLRAVSRQRLSVSANVIRGGILQGRLIIYSDAAFLRAKLMEGVGAAFLLALVATLVTSAISLLLLRSSIRPVETLTKAMEEAVSSDTFAKQVDASRDDEIGRLGRSFNKMMTGLIERDQVIQTQVETLEDTVEKRTRQYRLAKENAEQANMAKSDFLATMSHEIRTPLNGMLVMSELLTNSALPDRQKRYSEVIQSSGQGLLAIINDILDLSKIEASKLELEAIPVDLDVLIGNTLTLFAGKAAEKGLSLGVYVSPEAPSKVIGDPTRLGQILTNLINNALKFTEAGGVVVHLAPLKQGSGLLLRVVDTGIGIPKDRQAEIFEAFSQADQSTTRKYGGTGLGLSICQKLVTAMNGSLHVISEEGKGSSFECRLPLDTQARYNKLPMQSDKQAAVMDDGRTDTRLLALMLQTYGLPTLLCSQETVANISPDYIIGSPASLKSMTRATGQRVCLTEIGEQMSEDLLRSGEAADALLLPSSPEHILRLVQRMQTGELAGLKALNALSQTSKVNWGNLSNLCVAAADDNAVNREVLNEALQTLGVKAHIYHGGRPLLNELTKLRPDIILLDISMPDMDGRMVLEELKRRKLEPQPRIAALTAHMTMESRKQLEADGFETVISKPFTVRQLADFMANEVLPNTIVAPEPTCMTESSDLPLWDKEVLVSFEASTGKSGFAMRMMDLFKENSLPALQALASCLGKSAEDKRKSVHALKSMCSTVGALQLVEQCERIEAKPEVLSEALVKEIATNLYATLIAMQQHIDRKTAA